MTKTEKRDAALSLVAASERVVRTFSLALEADLQKSGYHDLSFSQAMILVSIRDGKTRPSEIRTHAIGQGTNVSYGLSGLERSGYVKAGTGPDERDRRAKRFSLTRKGGEAVNAVNASADRHAPRMREEISALSAAALDAIRVLDIATSST